MGFDLGDLTKIPSDEERIAQALSKIQEGLECIDDPHVWSWERESPGLFTLLEDCVGSEYYAIALSLAFALGQAAVVGKADPAALSNARAAVEARRRGARNSRIEPIKRADEWKAVARRVMDADGGSLTDEKMTEKICAELGKLRLTCSRRTVFNYVRQLRRLPTRHLSGTH